MTYTTQNGWTKAAMIARIRTRNNGTPSVNPEGLCRYGTEDGNHCAVGCFIPAGTKLEREYGDIPLGDICTPWTIRSGVPGLLEVFPELIEAMPLSVEGLREIQNVHDESRTWGATPTKDVRDVLEAWIRANVTDDPLLTGAPADVAITESAQEPVKAKAIQALGGKA